MSFAVYPEQKEKINMAINDFAETLPSEILEEDVRAESLIAIINKVLEIGGV